MTVKKTQTKVIYGIGIKGVTEEMEKVESKFNEECKEDCVVHKLVTHNTCLFCSACRKSPYLKDELLGKSDEEIEAIQKEVKEELGE